MIGIATSNRKGIRKMQYVRAGRDETIFTEKGEAEDALLILSDESGFLAGDVVEIRQGEVRLETYWHPVLSKEADLPIVVMEPKEFQGMAFPYEA
jgi:hypothetical protein